MLRSASGLKPDKWNQHGRQSSQNIESRVGDVQSTGIPAHEDQGEGMHGNEIDDEHVTAPSANHPKVK